VNLDKLDDADHPTYTIGQAAELLGVQQAFLRNLESSGLLRPHRSDGGHRRYSRRQLELAMRIRALFDEGHSLAATARIVQLEDALATANAEITDLRDQIADEGPGLASETG
jgi:MerR family transcriptional regulator/heat shock protein HspR